jgi:hypothetical protein
MNPLFIIGAGAFIVGAILEVSKKRVNSEKSKKVLTTETETAINNSQPAKSAPNDEKVISTSSPASDSGNPDTDDLGTDQAEE